MKKIFKYIENIWLGSDGKPSVRRVLALAFSIDLIINLHKMVDIVYKLGIATALATSIQPEVVLALNSGLSAIGTIIFTEAGLIASLLALTTYQNTKDKSQDN